MRINEQRRNSHHSFRIDVRRFVVHLDRNTCNQTPTDGCWEYNSLRILKWCNENTQPRKFICYFVLVSYCYCNKWPQMQWLRNMKLWLYIYGGQRSKIGLSGLKSSCGQDCCSWWPLGRTFSCLLQFLTAACISWPGASHQACSPITVICLLCHIPFCDSPTPCFPCQDSGDERGPNSVTQDNLPIWRYLIEPHWLDPLCL